MKKIIPLIAAAMLAIGLCACTSSNLEVTANGDFIHAQAQNQAEGSGSGDIKIEEGYGVCINHIVEKGSFHVKIVSAGGEVVFDDDIDDNIAEMIDAEPGDYEVMITADKATGTLDIIPYDKQAQAMAEATMPEYLKEMVDEQKENKSK